MTALRSLAACSLVVLAAPAQQLTFAPPADATSEKVLEISVDITVDDFHISFGGQEVDPEMMGADADMSFAGELAMHVTETYLKSADGRPVDMLRSFDELSLEMTSQGESDEVDEFAEMEGQTVRFRWDEDEGEYDVTYHEDEGDEELLDDLSADMDLRLLLPEDEVEAGDSWDVDAAGLYPLFFPGGLVGSSDGDGDSEISSLIEDELTAQLEPMLEEFKVRCTYKGQRDVDGVDAGEITFEFDGQGDIDLAELITSIAASQEGAPELSDVTADLSLTMKGSGTLFWNAKKGHVMSFDMSSELGASVAIDVAMSVEGQDFGVEVSAELSGTGEWALTAK